MTDFIEYTIHGDDMQIVEIELDPEEGVLAEAGAMLYMGPGINMETSSGGGVFKGLKRMIAGEGFFVPTFKYHGDEKGYVAFGAPYPGKIIPIDLAEFGGSFRCQRDSFLCAEKSIEVSIELTKKLGAGLFGGEGFILQRLVGDGLAFVHGGGTVLKRDLEAGEELRVDTGCLVAMSSTLDYDIKFVGGFTNALFGGEGLFLAKLSGPGRVYLQSLPFSRLADRILAAFRSKSKGETRFGGKFAGGD